MNVRGLAEPHEGSADTCGIFCEWFREDLAQDKFQRCVSGPSALVNNGNVSSKASPTLLNQAFSCSRVILDANQAADFLSIVCMMLYGMLCNKRKNKQIVAFTDLSDLKNANLWQHQHGSESTRGCKTTSCSNWTEIARISRWILQNLDVKPQTSLVQLPLQV